jgi:hypothetical protein
MTCDELVADAERRRIPLSEPATPKRGLRIIDERPTLVLINGGSSS